MEKRVFCDEKWWSPIQPCGWRLRLKDEGSQDLIAGKEITIAMGYGNSILIWLEDDQFPPVVIGSWMGRKPLIGKMDFHKLPLFKRKQAQGGVKLWVAPWIYVFFGDLCWEKDKGGRGVGKRKEICRKKTSCESIRMNWRKRSVIKQWWQGIRSLINGIALNF